MNKHQLLTELSHLGVQLWVESGDQLRIRAPKGTLTPALKRSLSANKSDLIALLNRQAQAVALSDGKPLVKVPRDQPLPLSFAQERLWFLSHLEPNNPAYNERILLKLEGPLDVPVLEASLYRIIQRHEVLRTRFETVDGQPMQTIAQSPHFGLSVTDLSQHPCGEQDAACRAVVRQKMLSPFNLAKDLLIEASLLTLSKTAHILLVKVHHIIWDAKSADDVFVRELAALYSATLQNELIELPELPIQYADFAVWQRSLSIETDWLKPQLNYWKQQLKDAPALLELPTDRPRSADQGHGGAHHTFKLSSDLTDQLLTFSQQRGATLFMTLLAAFKVLIYRYTAQTDICIGTPITSRTSEALENLIGFFINMVVLRTPLSSELSFEDLLNSVKAIALGAYDHGDLPFERLVEELHPERNLSHTPLFQAGFALYTPVAPIEMTGLNVTPYEWDTGLTKFDLSLSFQESSSGLIGQWEYKTALFDHRTVVKMAEHFQQLLTSLLESPQQSLSCLSMLTPDEQKMLADWNATQDSPSLSSRCIHQLFEEQVERSPDAIAVRYNDQSLTYQQLNNRANQLARYLQQLGVQPEHLVGISIERSLEMIVGLLAIFKAGGAYVPLDPNYPLERLKYMADDAKVSVLLTQQKYAHLLCEQTSPQDLSPQALSQQDLKILCLDTLPTTVDQLSEQNLVSDCEVSQLAYVIYTSGSTGRPKGVMVEHLSLVNFIRAAITAHRINSRDQVLQSASINFDAADEEIFSCLVAGGTLVLRPEQMLDSVTDFIKNCQDFGLTALFLPTAYWQQLVSELVRTHQQLPHTVRVINIGGERLLPDKLKLWQNYVQDNYMGSTKPTLIHGYGPTEATVVTTFCNLSEFLASAETGADRVPIGRPIANVQTYVLDPHQQPVPIGVPGELYVGGTGVARGYLGNEQLTTQKFVDLPLDQNGRKAPTKLYRTGDRVRYLADGNLEFLERIDHQIKIRGFRVELGEVESRLSAQVEIAAAAAAVVRDLEGRQRLVAYYAASQATSQFEDKLRHALKQKLPDYMLPSVYIRLQQLPLTPSGKVDRNALPAPQWNQVRSSRQDAAPRNTLEQALVRIWREVLNCDQVGIYDNFFELGGDSIVSIQIVACASQAGLALSPRQLVQHQTIAELAEVVQIAPLSTTAEQLLVTGVVPLTPIQRWFFEQDWAQPHHFNQSMLFLVPAHLQTDVLRQSLAELSMHHDALRMKFIRTGTDWQQINGDDSAPILFDEVDCSHIPASEQTAFVTNRSAAYQASLDLSSGMLIRVVLFRFGTEAPDRLLFVAHHLVVDGVSWRILVTDLSRLYQQKLQKESTQFPPKTTPFKHWAERLSHYAQSQDLRAELSYWRAQVASPVASIPLDIPANSKADLKSVSANTEGSVDQITVRLNKPETAALLTQVPLVYGTKINEVLLSALVKPLSTWIGGSHPLLIDLEGHGREDLFAEIDLSRTVGWFTSTFPITLNAQLADSPQQSLQATQKQLSQIPNNGIGYGLLRYLNEDSEIRQQLSAQPQANISFNYLGQLDQMFSDSVILGFAPEGIGAQFSPLANRSYLLDIVGSVTEGQLEVSWFYSKTCHLQSTVEQLANAYMGELRSLITQCQLTAYPLTDDVESAYPLAKMQALMADHYADNAQNAGVYHCQQLLTVEDAPIDVQSFKQALKALVTKHPTLRTRLVLKDNLPSFQVVKAHLEPFIEHQDISSLDPVEQDAFLNAAMMKDRQNAFETSNPDCPLFRFYLFQQSDTQAGFLMSFHHAIMDGWSSSVLLNQLQELYAVIKHKQRSQKYLQPSAYPSAVVSNWHRPNVYQEFVALEQSLSQSKEAASFWNTYLRDYTYQPLFPCLEPSQSERMLTDKASPANRQILDTALVNALIDTGRDLNASPKAIFLSAYLNVLSDINQYQEVVGIVSNGRTQQLSDPLGALGLFWNIVPFRQSTIDSKLLQAKKTQDNLVDIDPYVSYPLTKVLSERNVPALFFATFNFVNFHADTNKPIPNSFSLRERSSHDKFHFPLNFTISLGSDLKSTSFQVEYDSQYFSQERISLMMRKYVEALEMITCAETALLQ